MKKAVFAVCAMSVGLTGCQGPCASMGWKYEIYKPATLNGAAVVASQSGPVGIAGLGTGSIVHDVAGMGPLASPSFSSAATLRSSSLTPRLACDLEDVCRRLEDLERRFRILRPDGSKPMPSAPE